MPDITPMLWFESQAVEAAQFYCGLFPNSKITQTNRYSESGPGAPGSVMTVAFELDGKAFVALNGGPHDRFNDAVSFVVNCKDQAEIDRYWDGLLAGGGTPVQCGWLKDRFGVSWQITPQNMGELVGGEPEKAKRAVAAMTKMVKLDIAALKAARDGSPVAAG